MIVVAGRILLRRNASYGEAASASGWGSEKKCEEEVKGPSAGFSVLHWSNCSRAQNRGFETSVNAYDLQKSTAMEVPFFNVAHTNIGAKTATHSAQRVAQDQFSAEKATRAIHSHFFSKIIFNII